MKSYFDELIKRVVGMVSFTMKDLDPVQKPKLRRDDMKIELFKSASGHWFFRIKSGNGQIICQSEGYVKKASALKTIYRLQEGLSGSDVQVKE